MPPAALKLVVRVATPELRVAVPRLAPPLMKVTVPLAVLGVTVAVSTVLAPTDTGLSDELNAVELASKLTLSANVEEVLLA